MGGIVSTVGSWIKAGWNLAVKGVKWIWECVSSLFGKVTNLLREVMSWVSYKRETDWIQCETTRLEVGHERIRVGIERDTLPAASQQVNSSDPIPPSDPAKTTKLMDEVRKKSPQMLKGLEEAVEYIKKLSNIADEDLEHQNRNETERKLRDLHNQKSTIELGKFLDSQPKVNPCLA